MIRVESNAKDEVTRTYVVVVVVVVDVFLHRVSLVRITDTLIFAHETSASQHRPYAVEMMTRNFCRIADKPADATSRIKRLIERLVDNRRSCYSAVTNGTLHANRPRLDLVAPAPR